MLSRTLRSDSSVVTSYAWNAEHQLTEVGLPDGGHVTFRYDPLGNRIEIAHGGNVRRYVYEGGVISAEYDGVDTLVATYVHAPPPSSSLEMERDGHRYFYSLDGMGSVIALTDVAGSVIERNRYDAYGNLVATNSHGNPFAFTGAIREEATGLYHMPLRSYDPSIGRFISEDPVPAVNPYRYASNNPVNLMDPSGASAVAQYGIALQTIDVGNAAVAAVIAWESTCLLYIGLSKIEIVLGNDDFMPPPMFAACRVGKWTCKSKCQVVDIVGGTGVTYGPTFSAKGPSERIACKNAEKEARQATGKGNRTRHCYCFDCEKR